jgi:hypothetical protein
MPGSFWLACRSRPVSCSILPAASTSVRVSTFSRCTSTMTRGRLLRNWRQLLETTLGRVTKAVKHLPQLPCSEKPRKLFVKRGLVKRLTALSHLRLPLPLPSCLG